MTPSHIIIVVAVFSVAICHADPTPVANDPAVIPRMLADARSLEEVPFSQVVESATNWRVLPVDPETHRDVITALSTAMDRVLERLSAPGHKIHVVGRINEASRYIEDELCIELNAIPGWECSIPATTAGATQRSGYPDLLIKTPAGIFFIDPKLVAEASEASALRTFYYEPRVMTNKIQYDAVHLLIGVSHAGWKDGRLILTGWKLVDLSSLPVRLKAEFQASNRELYTPERTIAASSPKASGRKK
jgi:hypothetical protein